MRNVRRTRKQVEIMRMILDAVDEGIFLTAEQIHKRLSYENSFGALRVSLKHLDDHGIISRHGVGLEQIVKPTHKSYMWFRRH